MIVPKPPFLGSDNNIPWTNLLFASTLVFGLWAYTSHSRKKLKTGLSLPPGPKEPLIGSIRKYPRTHRWQQFTAWQKEYGDIIHLDLLGNNIVILNTIEACEDLFVKRANTFSDRTVPYMAIELMGFSFSVPFLPFNHELRACRRIFRKGLNPQALCRQQPLIDSEIRVFLDDVKDRVVDPEHLLLGYIGSIVLKIAYGEAGYSEELVKLNVEAVEKITEALDTFWMVDVFRWLRHMPSWFPGTGFKPIVEEGRKRAYGLREVPFQKVKALFNIGVRDDSLAMRILEDEGPSKSLQDTLSAIFGGGVDTTSHAIHNLLYALLLHPEVQKKCHEELDRVVGRDRLPTPEDRDNLPYLNAVWKESARWGPTSPIALPHSNTQDEIYKDYIIPKGSTVFANQGFMLNDPRIWRRPECFMPERFLPSLNNPAPLDPWPMVFGVGRRVCPGKDLAEQLGFHFFAMICWAFVLETPPGERPIRPEERRYQDLAVGAPEPFQCVFKSRFEEASALWSLSG